MLIRPRIKPHFQVEIAEGQGVFLLSERSKILLHGRVYQLLVPLIDGRSLDCLMDALPKEISPALAHYALARLERKGYISESACLPTDESALWALHNVDPATALHRLAHTPVSLTTLGSVEPERFREILQSTHVRLDEPGQLRVVLTDDPLIGALQSVNDEALCSGQPWLLVKALGCTIWVGPLFVPGRTGCWECLAQRLRAKRVVEGYIQQKTNRDAPLQPNRCATPATLEIAWGLAASAISAWIVREDLSALEGKVLTFNTLSWQTQFHVLVRRPQCPACGEPPQLDRSILPVVLTDQQRRFTREGDYRVISPEATLARYEHHVSPITGVVKALERESSSKDGDVHVYVATHDWIGNHECLADLRRSLRIQSSGKGPSDLQAKVSALCEALERYSAVFQGDESRRTARFQELGSEAIHPNTCMCFSVKQYTERNAWNARGSRFNRIPLPFDEGAEIDWTPVWSLTRQQQSYLPTGYCYHGYPYPGGRAFCVAGSSGTAAGNTLEEAILYGLLELVERDAVAIWWYNRLRRPGVILDSFDTPYFEQLQAHLLSHYRDLWLLDLTADLEIPVFAALSRRTDQPEERIIFGFGAHLDPKIAVMRAMTELTQLLPWSLRAGRWEIALDATEDRDAVEWLHSATLANQPYLIPDVCEAPREASHYVQRWTGDLMEDVLTCQVLIERQGLELFVLDQTRPDIALPVAKVIVPGLRPSYARFAPGRLYEIPVRLGWLPRHLTEEELNPVGMFV
jgi:oxazoline/thiazoline synthase